MENRWVLKNIYVKSHFDRGEILTQRSALAPDWDILHYLGDSATVIKGFSIQTDHIRTRIHAPIFE